MVDKEIYKELLTFDKKLIIALSLFVIISSIVGIFLIAGSRTGVTGFSIFERAEIKGWDTGVVLFVILVAAILIALFILVYSLGKKE